MERRYFELDSGYLNIDDEALYFTRSGNWQEALETKELHRGLSSRFTIHSLLGLTLVFSRTFLELLHVPTRGTEGTLLSLGLAGLGALVLYRTFRHDLAPSFRIPWSKLIAADRSEERTTLRWQDGDGKERERRVRMPDEALDIAQSKLEGRTRP